MPRLRRLISESLHVIREARAPMGRLRRPVALHGPGGPELNPSPGRANWRASGHIRRGGREPRTPQESPTDVSMPRLERLISESLHVIREARARYRRLAVLWSMGKDWDVERPHADRAGPVERPRRRGATARRNRAVKRQPPGRLLPVRPRALQGPWTGPAGAGPSCCPAGRLACCQARAYRAPSGLWPMGAAYPGRWPGLRDGRTFGAGSMALGLATRAAGAGGTGGS
jgi:hypothetical protein